MMMVVVVVVVHDHSVAGINATPYEDNYRYFNVVLEGPVDSPYQRTSIC